MSTPNILAIDDSPSELESLRLAIGSRANVTVSPPQDITERHIREANLILVDWDLSKWRRSENTVLLENPPDGFAVAGTIRSILRNVNRPVAIAIHSGRLDDLALGVAEHQREHVIARQRDVEWVFPKSRVTEPKIDAQVVSLATAVSHLPPSIDNLELVYNWMGIPNEQSPWRSDALGSLEAARVPLAQVLTWSQGISLLRWFLHRVLPYGNGILMDSDALALRLRANADDVAQAVLDGAGAKFFDEARFRGELANFVGPRWWKSGVDFLLSAATGGRGHSPDSIQGALSKACGFLIRPSDVADPVYGLNERFEPLATPLERNDSVRVIPDDWPSWIELPRMTIADVNSDPQLRAIVATGDRDRLIEK
jgi:hypothetical protein